MTPAISLRSRHIGVVSAAVAVTLAFATPVSGFPTEVTYHYRSGDPSAKLQRGITALSFAAATENGKPKEVVPEEFILSGFGGGTVLKAEFGITAELTCEEEGHTNPALAAFYVQHGKGGIKGLRVRGNRLRYVGSAFNGETSSGKVEIRARFARQSKVASGTLLIKGAKALTLVGEGTNCHTGTGAKPKPLKWRLHGEL